MHSKYHFYFKSVNRKPIFQKVEPFDPPPPGVNGPSIKPSPSFRKMPYKSLHSQHTWSLGRSLGPSCGQAPAGGQPPAGALLHPGIPGNHPGTRPSTAQPGLALPDPTQGWQASPGWHGEENWSLKDNCPVFFLSFVWHKINIFICISHFQEKLCGFLRIVMTELVIFNIGLFFISQQI